MEFGEWLFVNEFPIHDALDQVSVPFQEAIFVVIKFNPLKERLPHFIAFYRHPLRAEDHSMVKLVQLP